MIDRTGARDLTLNSMRASSLKIAESPHTNNSIDTVDDHISSNQSAFIADAMVTTMVTSCINKISQGNLDLI